MALKEKGHKQLENTDLENIITETAEYIISLPNGTETTVEQASFQKCGFDAWSVEGDLLKASLEIVERVKKTEVVLDFSAHEDELTGLPFRFEFVVWQPRLKSARIISNLMCFGPCPEPEDPVEQRLTISSTGRVWFSEYLYGNGYPEKYPLGRKIQLSIGKDKAAAILSKLADVRDSGMPLMRCTDIGTWEMTLTDIAGNKSKLSCSMCGLMSEGIELSNYIQERIPIESLAVFGDNFDDEEDDELCPAIFPSAISKSQN